MPGYKVFRDGNMWCATGAGFVNLQESLAGFGETPVDALGVLITEEDAAENKRCKGMRRWKCGNCQTEFNRGRVPSGFTANCPRCKAGGQYTSEIESLPAPLELRGSRSVHQLVEIGECEGGCVDHGGHKGDVLATRVRGSDGKNWGLFSYCETARLIDKQRGMDVLEIPEPAYKSTVTKTPELE